MKNILYIILCISIVCSNETIGLVMKKKGKVSYTPYSNKKIQNLDISESLFNQDLIETGKNGFTNFVYLDDGSSIKIHKNSEIYVQGDIYERKIVKQINIATGKLKLDINKQSSSNFKVITPTSVASVKGTRFWVDVNGKKGDVFHGLSGSVQIKNSITGNIVELSKNTTAISLPDGTLEIKEIDNMQLRVLEKLEESVGEPTDDMPSINDNGSYNNQGSFNQSSNSNINEIVIRLKNSNSEQKSLIIKYSD